MEIIWNDQVYYDYQKLMIFKSLTNTSTFLNELKSLKLIFKDILF